MTKEEIKAKHLKAQMAYLKRNPEQMKQYLRDNPWLKNLNKARYRCNNKNNKGYRYYGGKGIRCFLTISDVKFMWERDNAYSMDKPSIDRIDSNGNYVLSNCRFIEQKINSGMNSNSRKTHCKNGHEFSVENTYFKKDGRRCRTCCRERNRRWAKKTFREGA